MQNVLATLHFTVSMQSVFAVFVYAALFFFLSFCSVDVWFLFVSRCHVIISYTWIFDLWESATLRYSLHPSSYVVAVSFFFPLCVRPRVGRQIAIDPLVLWVLWFNFARSNCHHLWNLRLLHSQVKLRSNNISNGVCFVFFLASASHSFAVAVFGEEMQEGIKWTNFSFWWACNIRCRGDSRSFHNIWIRHFNILFAQRSFDGRVVHGDGCIKKIMHISTVENETWILFFSVNGFLSTFFNHLFEILNQLLWLFGRILILIRWFKHFFFHILKLFLRFSHFSCQSIFHLIF